MGYSTTDIIGLVDVAADPTRAVQVIEGFVVSNEVVEYDLMHCVSDWHLLIIALFQLCRVL